MQHESTEFKMRFLVIKKGNLKRAIVQYLFSTLVIIFLD